MRNGPRCEAYSAFHADHLAGFRGRLAAGREAKEKRERTERRREDGQESEGEHADTRSPDPLCNQRRPSPRLSPLFSTVCIVFVRGNVVDTVSFGETLLIRVVC